MPRMNIVADIHSVNQTLLKVSAQLKEFEDNISSRFCIPDDLPPIQKFIITAFLNGYIGSKEILEFGKLQNKKLSLDHVQYHIRVLRDIFDVSNRSQLLRYFMAHFVRY
jgi:hypothetical protein